MGKREGEAEPLASNPSFLVSLLGFLMVMEMEMEASRMPCESQACDTLGDSLSDVTTGLNCCSFASAA